MAVNVRGGWKSPRKVATGTVDLTIPIGGGAAYGTITIAGMTTIEYVFEIAVTQTDPMTHDVYTPQKISVSSNIIGVTLGGATGTTARVEALVYGW